LCFRKKKDDAVIGGRHHGRILKLSRIDRRQTLSQRS